MFTPDEERVLEIGFDAALKPINDALSNIVGPASDTIGLMIKAMLCHQMRNVIKVYGSAAEMLASVGLHLNPVPLKVLKPILDAASMEDDEEMQDVWAALLANASSNDPDVEVTSSYIEIL